MLGVSQHPISPPAQGLAHPKMLQFGPLEF